MVEVRKLIANCTATRVTGSRKNGAWNWSSQAISGRGTGGMKHRRGLGKTYDDETYKRDKRRADGIEDAQHIFDEEDPAESAMITDEVNWNGKDYLPQGTVGAVVLDSTGTICAATSTGGLTNKLPGRNRRDTPTIGAGFWSEEWQQPQMPPESTTPTGLAAVIEDCMPGLSDYIGLKTNGDHSTRPYRNMRAVGMSGTGNGDSFLRMNAVRTAAAIARYSSSAPYGSGIPLQDAVSNVAGPGGMLQESAADRWGKTGEGEGGVIGLDFSEGKGRVVFDFNCGGMFRSWVDDDEKERFYIFRDEE